ncbi:MAG: HAMP domain-containing sensor histidine kinase [Bryobacteraceae bacterium]
MRIRTRVVVAAAANLVLVLAALLVFVRVEFRAGMASILLAPGEARLRRVAHNVAARTRGKAASEQARVVKEAERRHGVEIGIFIGRDMRPIGGSLLAVPAEVRAMLTKGDDGRPRHPPPSGKAGPGPPRSLPHGPAILPGQIGPDDPIPGPQHAVEFYADPGSSGYWFAVRAPIFLPGEDTPRVGGIFVVRSSNLIFTPLIFDLRPWLFCFLAIAGITLLCWGPLIHRLTSAVRQIHVATERFAQGQLQDRLPISNDGGEIQEVAESLNRMAAQLGGHLHGQKRFLGDIAHELAAPISRTQAALCILEERVDRQPERRYLDGLRDEVEQMSGLVRELLDFSKAGLTEKRVEPSPVDVRTLAAAVIAREAAGARVRLVGGEPLTALADPAGLERALGNVIRNAIRYAGHAGEITVSAQRKQQHVHLVIADRGPGVPEDVLEHLFQPFYRVDDSRSRQSGGAGLGLAIVKAAVTSSGGTVACRNRPEGGLEVTIRLRCCPEITAEPDAGSKDVKPCT